MCLAIPSKIISINQDTAVIDVFGARKDVNIMLLPETPRIGDFVLVHAGFAIQSITAEAVQSGEVMHEFSIAQSILDIATEQCNEQKCSIVESIHVRLGKATGVMQDSLQFAFDAIKENTPSKNAKLTFEIVPVGGICHGCNKEFDVPEAQYVFECPLCGSASFEINRGREMEVAEMEMH
jgi:hydrogenase nickel incorporation protein HypA/HybF